MNCKRINILSLPNATKKIPELSAKDKRDIQKLAECFIKNRTESNFNSLIRRCEWGLKLYVSSFVNDRDDIDDILSLTMENIYFKINSFNENIAKFSTWMYAIARNTAISFLRNDGYKDNINTISLDNPEIHLIEMMSEDDSSICSDTCFFSDDEIEDIVFDGIKTTTYTKSKIFYDLYDASIECMNFLPEHIRETMMRRYIDKEKISRISMEMHEKESSIKNWIKRGHELLKKEIIKRNGYLYSLYKENIK